ncbi:MAG: hypothetical protein A3F78_03360 [Burkholderiales bacterium RIFCSPLOWO2_12_FULL_61_40]|nr:MAG: hypothetical protein A3F78_03360 [Burkholderiales bacterium RIFCSPLOWO2_12_FULL_61_40]
MDVGRHADDPFSDIRCKVVSQHVQRFTKPPCGGNDHANRRELSEKLLKVIQVKKLQVRPYPFRVQYAIEV